MRAGTVGGIVVSLDWGVRAESVGGRLAIDEIVECRPEMRLECYYEPLDFLSLYAGPCVRECRFPH